MEAAHPSSHFGEQFQQIPARFCPFSLFAGELVQITPDKTVNGGVLFNGNSPDLLQNRVLDGERNVSRHASTVTVFLCKMQLLWVQGSGIGNELQLLLAGGR